MLHVIRWFSIACALLGLPALAQAQATYPDRPVKFVIAFPPGGATDTFFRVIAAGRS
jgi:tripartite-type tricarboxylate transporter receptor subunit TctC